MTSFETCYVTLTGLDSVPTFTVLLVTLAKSKKLVVGQAF